MDELEDGVEEFVLECAFVRLCAFVTVNNQCLQVQQVNMIKYGLYS